jgi:Fe2+ or Zn2+ uptake regulation protein
LNAATISVAPALLVLSCVRCGKIVDFINEDFNGLRIPKGIKKKYTVLGKKVVIECICDECSRKNKRGGRR